jgi:hypothetical protein
MKIPIETLKGMAVNRLYRFGANVGTKIEVNDLVNEAYLAIARKPEMPVCFESMVAQSAMLKAINRAMCPVTVPSHLLAMRPETAERHKVAHLRERAVTACFPVELDRADCPLAI